MTISLSWYLVTDVKEPGVLGLYRAEGLYRRGMPVLQLSGGLFTLSVWGNCWRLGSGVRGELYLRSRSALCSCPADPRAARDEGRGQTLRRYWRVGRVDSVQWNKCQV